MIFDRETSKLVQFLRITPTLRIPKNNYCSHFREYEEQSKLKPFLAFPGNLDSSDYSVYHNCPPHQDFFQYIRVQVPSKRGSKDVRHIFFKITKNHPRGFETLFELNTGHSDKTCELHYTLSLAIKNYQELFAATGKIRQDSRRRRSQSGTSSVLNQPEVPAENTSISLSENLTQDRAGYCLQLVAQHQNEQ